VLKISLFYEETGFGFLYKSGGGVDKAEIANACCKKVKHVISPYLRAQ